MTVLAPAIAMAARQAGRVLPWECHTVSASVRAVATKAADPAERGLVEVREYIVKPEAMGTYMELTTKSAGVRKELLPFLGMFTCDIGSCLGKITHLYHYKNFDERDRIRAAAAKDPRWSGFIKEMRTTVQHQSNRVMLEAGPIYDALQLPPTSQYKNPTQEPWRKAVYELRSYQLHPGYGSVPLLVDAFKDGLPAKVKADPEQGQLVFFGYTDVGMLNTVTELWRYSSAQACIRARQAARTVPEWRQAIAKVTPTVQHFTSEFLHPVSFSPWQ